MINIKISRTKQFWDTESFQNIKNRLIYFSCASLSLYASMSGKYFTFILTKESHASCEKWSVPFS